MFLEDKRKFPLIEPKADPFTLDSLISWLETKEPAEKYNYLSIDDCLLCQYVSHAKDRSVLFDEAFACVNHNFPHREIAYGCNGSCADCDAYGHTFGAALTRARSIKAGT